MIALMMAGALAAQTAEAAIDGPLVLPEDVRAFIARRDECEHFIGEEPYDRARRRFLARAIRKSCKGVDKRLAALREKYRGDPPVIAALADYYAVEGGK